MSRISTLSIAGIFFANLSWSGFYVNALPAPPSQTNTSTLSFGTIKLPPPTGKYVVGTTNLILTDHSRLENLSPTPNTTARTFVAQIYYPTFPLKNLKKYALSPYLTPGLARFTEKIYMLPDHILDGVITNSYVDAPVVLPHGEAKEVVLFSAGSGGSRSYYTSFHENLASMGYVVIAMEHLYDVSFVDIPGLGDFWNTYQNMTVDPVIEATSMNKVRVGDSLFILNSLANKNSELVMGLGLWWSKNAKVVMYGHSLGGSTSLSTMLDNKTPTKIVGGLNLDGTFWGPTAHIPNPPPSSYIVKAPFLIWGAPGHSREENESWTAVYDHVLQGWKRELSLEGATHVTYSDYPSIVDLFGLRSFIPKDLVDEVLGTISGVRSLEVIREVIACFVSFAFRGDNDCKKLLDGAGKKRWPEVDFKF
ncbi:hypothetical protein L211DRAFT_795618 [Terfezia boudieri ATCC MYA-4762]|uniref:1-alkyl-2-acetylglycerophosphocholine esterase n=1 Tax=Terfezia boudieri ATCC MYA-4762 TaxID=1051890 RepID=A0A3N4LLQ1_9PEZI|nr:hypothetical protein L211DRAFT_795618 [Terfezia boudieri ATCC MYA-4762]